MAFLQYPPARRVECVDVLHDRRVSDPYRWLEAGDSQECRRWLDAQEELFTSRASSWPMRSFFRELLWGLTNAGTTGPVTPPVERGARQFFLRRGTDQELPVLMCAEGDAPGRVLLDPVAVDPSGVTTLELWRPSWTGQLVAYQLSVKGSEEPEMHVLNVGSGHEVEGPLLPGRPSPVAWLPDDSGFYYVAGSATSVSRQVRLHRLGTTAHYDVTVFETPFRQLSVTISPDGKWLSISCAPGVQVGNAVHLADLDQSSLDTPVLRLVHDGIHNGTHALLKFGPPGLIYAITDSGAPGGKVCTVTPSRSPSDAWPSLITMEPGHVLSGCVALTEPEDGQIRYLVTSTAEGSTRLSLHEADGELLSIVPTPSNGPATLTNLTAAPGADHAWFLHTDFLHAPVAHRFALTDRKTLPHPAVQDKQHPGAEAVVRQVTYTSDDGTEIGMYLVLPSREGPDTRPAILTAYGGFGASAAPSYNPSTVAWVKAGGIYAIASIRGGGEKGAAWHAAGSGPNKPNAFNDFSAAARWLIDQGWTTPAQLAIRGTSHSGLTVAAAITRDPTQYAAAICSDALTDMIRYPQFGLGTWWLKEFGDPNNQEDVDTLLNYSPYHNVTPDTPYPAILLTSPRHDPRVGEQHIKKFTAALQHATTSANPILLRTEDNVGHGERAASLLINLQTDTLAFCAAYTGLTTPEGPPAQPR
ncbi:prolyl oligopeptidase family serine peptidase [Streptomyces sp. NPDC055709]